MLKKDREQPQRAVRSVNTDANDDVLEYGEDVPIYYKEWAENEWRVALGMFHVNRTFFIDGYEKEDPSKYPWDWEKIWKDIRSPEQPSYESGLFWQNRKKIIYIPWIKARWLDVESHIMGSADTIVINGMADILGFDESTLVDNYGPLNNVWFFGSLRKLRFARFIHNNIRLPSTVQVIETNNEVNIIGFEDLIQQNKELEIKMSGIENMNERLPF